MLLIRIYKKLFSCLLQLMYFKKMRNSIVLSTFVRIERPKCVQLGNGVYINSSVWLNTMTENGILEISDGVYIGRFVQINCMRSIYIGKDVMLADRVYIADNTHCFDKRDIPISKQGFKFGGEVILRDGCWIGCGAVIMPGVKIGKNAVVGANAVVTKDVPDFAIVAGVPAKIIRYI